MFKAKSAGVKGAVFGERFSTQFNFRREAIETRKGNCPINFATLSIVNKVKEEAAAALRDVKKGPIAIAVFVEYFAVIGFVARGFGQTVQPIDIGIENVMLSRQLSRENTALDKSQAEVAQVSAPVGIVTGVRARLVVGVAIKEGF